MHTKSPSDAAVIYVVDDDISMRESLVDLFRSIDFEAQAFGSPDEFLTKADLERPGCLVLDVRLPRVSGIEFQAQLDRAGNRLPIVFMTGHGDISMSVRAMKAGAVDFLTKPFRDQDLLDAVIVAIKRDTQRRREVARNEDASMRFGILTSREREVMDLVVEGLMNKQIAFQLGISEITVKLHRGNLMRKMEVRSVPELVRLAQQIHGALASVAKH